MHEPIRVFEHESLRVGEKGLTIAHFDALVRYNERHGDRFFVVGHKRVRFSSYVGVVRVGSLTIEVLPKADRSEDGDRGKWRDVLVDMLRMCGYLKIESTSAAHLRLRKASLFDLYLEAFLNEVQTLVHQGLVKKYRIQEGNLPVLKGSIRFQQHISRNLVHRERFYTAHQTYDRNNRFNQIVASAVDVVGSTSRSLHLRGMADSLGLHFEEVARKHWHQRDFERLRLDRNTERYRKALMLARLILLNYQPDVRSGKFDVLAIFFDMNELFEVFVLRQLKKSEKLFDLQVRGQRSAGFWQADGIRKTIRPDILITHQYGQGDCTVLDTKWKTPRDGRPADSDLKQMYAYNMQFGASRSYLLYPQTGKDTDTEGAFTPPSNHPDLQHDCGMWYVDLLRDGHLRRNLGDDVLSRLVRDSEEKPMGIGERPWSTS